MRSAWTNKTGIGNLTLAVAAAVLIGATATVTVLAVHLSRQTKSAHLQAKALKKTLSPETVESRRLVSEAMKSEDAQIDASRNQIFIFTFFVWGILWAGTFGFLRAASKHQHTMVRLKRDSERHEANYRQVAENLPIGFFTYVDGNLEYTNRTWDVQTGRKRDEQPMQALWRSLYEEDRDRVLESLRHTAKCKASLQTSFRLVTKTGSVRYMESRGVPLRGHGDSGHGLLGFVLDVSESVQAQRELELKNAEVESTNVKLRQALTDLEDNLEATIQTLVKAVEAKDPYTAGHSERVMIYSLRIGQAMGLSPSDLRTLEIGTLVHDVGKIGIPDAILSKPEKLDASEFRVVEQHPVIGAQMVHGIPLFKDCIPIIRGHHERLDGSGYPDGLRGNEISTLIRISSVADAFDAMTSSRAYRTSMEPALAIELLRKDARKGMLDEKIIEILADIVQRDGVLWKEPNLRAA